MTDQPVDGPGPYPHVGDDAERALASSREDRDRTLAALHSLEGALATAAGSRDWFDEVRSELESLSRAMTAELKELNRPDSLLAMIAADRPRRFGPRIRGVREQYDDVTRQVGSLVRELGDTDIDDSSPAEIRHRCGSIIRSVHQCRARQTDLVYDALQRDLGKIDR